MPPKEATEAGAEGEEAGPVTVPPLPDGELEDRVKVFEAIFSDCPDHVAKKGSLDERTAEGKLEEESLTYGEMDMKNMHTLLNVVRQDYGPLYANTGTFVDLGSGCGKACVAAGLLHPFQKVVGVECLNGLSTFATTATEQYNNAALPEGTVKPEIELMKGDFVGEMDAKVLPLAAEAVLCLAVATCYGEEQMKALAAFAAAMPKDSLFVTFTQMLPESVVSSEDGGWTLLGSLLMQMVWGPSTCFIFKKQAPTMEVSGGDEEAAAPPS